MKAVSTVILTLLVGILLLYLIVGHDEFRFSTLGWQSQAQDLVREQGQVSPKLKAWLRKQQEGVYDLLAESKATSGKAEAYRRRAGELSGRMSYLDQQLSAGKQLLSEQRKEYQISGRRLTRQEMVAHLMQVADEYSRTSEEFESANQRSQKLAQTSQVLARQAEKLEYELRREMVSVEDFETESLVADLQSKVSETVSQVDDVVSGFSSGPYARAKEEWVRQINRNKAKAEYLNGEVGIGDVYEIDFRDPSDPKDLASIFRQIDRRKGDSTATTTSDETLNPATVAITE